MGEATDESAAGTGVYEIPEELRDIRELVHRLAQEQIAPRAAEIDEQGEYPWDIREARSPPTTCSDCRSRASTHRLHGHMSRRSMSRRSCP